MDTQIDIDIPKIKWLNSSGDITISWEEEDRDAVAELIQKKMQEGFSFFIVREVGKRGAAPKLKPGDPLTKAVLNKLKVDENVAGVVLDDADLMIALQSKVIQFSRLKRETTPVKVIRRATTPAEVVQSQTIAVKAIAGG